MITESQRKALEIIKHHPGIAPREFAAFMWPDSDGHRRHTKCGHGVTRGGGMNLAGGGYLGKLTRKGLIYRSSSASRVGQFGYKLTGAGERALA